MPRTRRRFSAQFKAKVAVEAIRSHKTTAQLAGEHQVHPGQITQWKRQLLEGLPGLFSRPGKRQEQEQQELTARLYQQIGQLKVELDWLKKKAGLDG